MDDLGSSQTSTSVVSGRGLWLHDSVMQIHSDEITCSKRVLSFRCPQHPLLEAVHLGLSVKPPPAYTRRQHTHTQTKITHTMTIFSSSLLGDMPYSGFRLCYRYGITQLTCVCVCVCMCECVLSAWQCTVPGGPRVRFPPVLFCRRLQSQQCFSWRPVRFALILRMRMPCCPWRSPLLVSSSSALSFTPPSLPSPFSLLYFVCSHSAPVIVFS